MLKIDMKNLYKNLNDPGAKSDSVQELVTRDIAVIGMSAKLPMADDLDEFWNNLKTGRDCVTDLPAGRIAEAGRFFKYKGRDTSEIRFKKGAYLERLDEFDYGFFNISPREAALMDPNQRKFLETAFMAVEDSGYGGSKLKGTKTGVYVGFVSDLAYQRFIGEVEPASIGASIPGNMASIIPGRVSYFMDLRGPSILIDTACSSSLVAIHTACCAIRNNECDMAIAGSVKLCLLPLEDDNMMGIESKNYICRAFDDDADGTCMGEGIMAVVLKPLFKALKDKDNIYCVIKGSAINQDGTSIGITAPNSSAQAAVIQSAWEDARVVPESIGYIEAHGTGTKLGDPIEIEGMTKAFLKYTDKKQFCAIGSVKTNLGHLDSAAGFAGFIKGVLSLKHKAVVPSIHYKTPNRNIDFKNSPVYVNDVFRQWDKGMYPRRCGVSAFGLSGTNCHIILEEALQSENPAVKNSRVDLFTLSAKSPGALVCLLKSYKSFFNNHTDLDFADVCFTVNTGRGRYAFRLAIVADDLVTLVNKIVLLIENGLASSCDDGIYYAGGNESKGEGLSEADLKLKALLSGEKTISMIEGSERSNFLKELGMLYADGALIRWDALYTGSGFKRISLPAYAFEKKRCWIDIPETPVNQSAVQAASGKSVPLAVLKGNSDGQYSFTQRLVGQVFSEMLGFIELDINADFYDLGGDSIIAMRIANSLEKSLERKIEISSLLEHPTVKELSLFIENNLSSKAAGRQEDELIPLEKNDFYSLSSAQKRIYFASQMDETTISYNIPVAVRIKGKIDFDKFQMIFNRLFERHEALRTSFTVNKGEVVQVIDDTHGFRLEHLETGESDLEAVLKSLIKPFDLSCAPLMRAAVISVSPENHILFYDMHHIISDGFSQAILLNEFQLLYRLLPLPELKIQYKDFAAWHNRQIAVLSPDKADANINHPLKQQEQYWNTVFAGELPLLQMPLDFKRPQNRVFTGNTKEFIIDVQTILSLKDFARKHEITLNSLLLSAYAVLLSLYSRQEEIVVGSLSAGRRHKELENVIGMFVNFVPVRFHVDIKISFNSYLKQSAAVIAKAYENQDYPFDLIIENLTIKLDRMRNPLFDTVFIFHNEFSAIENLNQDGLVFEPYKLETGTSKLDFKIDAYLETSGSLKCALEYNTGLFKEQSMVDFMRHFLLLLERILMEPDKCINSFEIFTPGETLSLEKKRKTPAHTNAVLPLLVSATFTSQPAGEYIVWWCKQFNIDVQLSYAPYNQVFQQLLDDTSLLAENKGVSLLLIRFEDWIRDDTGSETAKFARLEENFEKLSVIMQTKKWTVPCFAGIIPVSSSPGLSAKMVSYLKGMNNRWLNLLFEIENVFAIDFCTLESLYRMDGIFDAIKDKEAHMPFTDEFYAAMGTHIARKICALKRKPFKVVVLDCDNTLWNGICGEDGALGVKIDENFSALQRFMAVLKDKGILLALCSKNNEQNVWDVFEKNPGMVLSREHLAAWRINWQPKPDNIKDLASELNLGMDSFIFLDDSSVECCQVMRECPSVLTLQIPADRSQIPAFLEHVWAFDIIKSTEEDRTRTQMYLVEKKRQEVQKTRPTLAEFIQSLQLKVSFNLLQTSQIKRAVQLTQRTNQFNLSTIRRTEEELAVFIEQPGRNCFVIEVGDRFGEYGLTGLLITEQRNNCLFIDTFLLSCRVLGRGVENAVLVCLGRYAREAGIFIIEAQFRATEKNTPALDFFKNSGWTDAGSDGETSLFHIDVDSIKNEDNGIEYYYMSLYKSAEKTEVVNKADEYELDHIAIAVPVMADALEEYAKNGFELSAEIYDPLQNASLCRCTKANHDDIELVAPVNESSPVYRLVSDNCSHPYHLCYRVPDLNASLSQLDEKEIVYEVISDARQAVLFDNQKVMFIQVKDFGLVELVQTTMKKQEYSSRQNLTILNSITADPQRACEFLSATGYIQENSSLDHSGGLRKIMFSKPAAGRIQLLIPLDKSLPEYDFLLQNGANPFSISVDTSVKSIKPDFNKGWDVFIQDRETLFHKNFLLALENYRADQLLKLPVYQASTKSSALPLYQPPAGEIEKKLLDMWKEILGVQKIGANDSFFALGGHSLKAVVLLSAVSKEFNVQLLLTDIFRLKTIRMLASHIAGSRSRLVYSSINPAGQREFYPLSSSQKRIFLMQQMNLSDTSYNIPLAIKINGAIDRQEFEKTFIKLIARHEALRTSFEYKQGEPVQIVHEQAAFSLDLVKLAAEQLVNVLSGLVKPFDLSEAPLLRGYLFKIEDDEYLLYFEMHHIIADGLSFAILLDEFIRMYSGQTLPVLRIHYKDFSVWHNNLLQYAFNKKEDDSTNNPDDDLQEAAVRLKKSGLYWQDKFANMPPVLNMPLDFKRPAQRLFTGNTLERELDKELVNKLNALANSQDTTLNIVLMGMYSILLGKYSGMTDVVVGSLVAGRHHEDLKNIIGIFINFLPIRFELDHHRSVTEYLKRAAGIILEAYNEQDYPFEMIVENSLSVVDPSRNPLFDTALNFHNELEANDQSKAGGLLFRRYEIKTITSALDFKIDVFPHDESGLRFVLEYNTSLFTEESMLKFINNFFLLIEKALIDPGQDVKDIYLFDAGQQTSFAEKRKLNTGIKPGVVVNKGSGEESNPISPLEAQLIEIWKDILHIENPGANKSFFDLGGNSLKAISLIARIYREYNVEMTLTQLFDSPTIRKIAAFISSSALKKEYSQITPAAKSSFYPLSYSQKKIYSSYAMDHHSTVYNETLAVQIKGALAFDRIEFVFRQLINRHEVLRTSFELFNDTPVQRIAPAVDFNINSIQTNKLGIDDAITGFIQPFDLSKAPLIRVALIRVEGGNDILVCDLHHIISDGISALLLIRQFASLYNNQPLPALQIHYKDFAVWQEKFTAGESFKSHEKYWLTTFAAKQPQQGLPVDFPRTSIRDFQGASLFFELPNILQESLNRFVLETGSTLYMVLLSVLNILLSRYCGHDDITIGSPVSGRTHPDLENVIGMFIDTIALRNYPAKEKSFEVFLDEVKRNSLSALENHSYPMDRLAAKIGIQTDPTRNPLFDVVFVLQKFDAIDNGIQGLEFSNYRVPGSRAKFDLTLRVSENDGKYCFEYEYCTGLFKKETIERMAGDYFKIIEAVINNKGVLIKDIKLHQFNLRQNSVIGKDLDFSF